MAIKSLDRTVLDHLFLSDYFSRKILFVLMRPIFELNRKCVKTLRLFVLVLEADTQKMKESVCGHVVSERNVLSVGPSKLESKEIELKCTDANYAQRPLTF